MRTPPSQATQDREHAPPVGAGESGPATATGNPTRDGWFWIAGIGCGILLLLCLCIAGGALLYTSVVDAGPRAETHTDRAVSPPSESQAAALMRALPAMPVVRWTVGVDARAPAGSAGDRGNWC